MSLLLFSVFLALGVSALCSLLEATLLSYSTSQVSALLNKRPRVGKIWQNFKDNIERPIAVILVVNTAAHTIGATIAGAQLEKLYGPEWLIVFSLIFTYFMLQFTEILPKTIGVRYNNFLAPIVAPPLAFLVRVLRPILWFISLVNKPFEARREREETTLEEIAGLAAAARLSRVIDPRQAAILHAASQIETLRVRQLMTPRVDIQFLRLAQPAGEVLQVLRETPHTRLPLCDKDIDHPIGIVNVKDVLRQLNLTTTPEHEAQQADTGFRVQGEGVVDLAELRRDVLILPDMLSATQALARFQNSGIHLAIVVDEFGSTLGVITLEDVIEELVGDIRDEFDDVAPAMVRRDGDTYRVRARLSLHDLAAAIPDIGIDYTEESVDTVGGYMSQEMKRLPQKGDSMQVGNYNWTVVAADSRRVREILIAPVEPETAPPNDPESSTENEQSRDTTDEHEH